MEHSDNERVSWCSTCSACKNGTLCSGCTKSLNAAEEHGFVGLSRILKQAAHGYPPAHHEFKRINHDNLYNLEIRLPPVGQLINPLIKQ